MRASQIVPCCFPGGAHGKLALHWDGAQPWEVRLLVTVPVPVCWLVESSDFISAVSYGVSIDNGGDWALRRTEHGIVVFDVFPGRTRIKCNSRMTFRVEDAMPFAQSVEENLGYYIGEYLRNIPDCSICAVEAVKDRRITK